MAQPTRVLILLSCSRDKRDLGASPDQTTRRFTADLTDGGRALLSKRREILALLKGEPGRLYDEDRGGGYRDLRPSNRRLRLGADFGSSPIIEPIYLPAHLRYSGRFFARLSDISPGFWNKLPNLPVEIAFISALYGLLLWDEPIQNYDCHFGDYVGLNERDLNVARIWGGVLTASLCGFLCDERGKPRFGRIYDLLSEEDYQRVFDWNRIARDTRIEVFHRVFRAQHGPDILPDLANILGGDLGRFYIGGDPRGQFQSLVPYRVPDSTASVRFETSVLPEIQNTIESLKASSPRLKNAPAEMLKDLAFAEGLWRKTARSRNMPFSPVVVSYAGAVEAYLCNLNPELEYSTAKFKEALEWVRRAYGASSHAASNLEKLWQLRNRAAHGQVYARRQRTVTKEDASEARRLARLLLTEELLLKRG